MEMDEKSLEHLKRLTPRQAYDTVRQSVLANPWGASSEDMLGAFEQVVEAGILSWEEVERFEAAR